MKLKERKEEFMEGFGGWKDKGKFYFNLKNIK